MILQVFYIFPVRKVYLHKMTKLQFNSTVPNDIYYNNQSVNKVFYVDPNGVQTEVWPLTPTVSVGTTLTFVKVVAKIDTTQSGRDPRHRILVNFLDNGFLEIQSAEVYRIASSTLTTTPNHSSSFDDANQPTKTISDQFKWISTAASGSTFSGYQFKCADNVNTGPDNQPLVETRALSHFGDDGQGTYTGFTLGTAQLALDKTGDSDGQNTHTFTVKDPSNVETSFTIDFQINITL